MNIMDIINIFKGFFAAKQLPNQQPPDYHTPSPERIMQIQQESDAIHTMVDTFLEELTPLKSNNGKLNLNNPKVRKRLAAIAVELSAMQKTFTSYVYTPDVIKNALLTSQRDFTRAHPAFSRVNKALAEYGLRADIIAGFKKNNAQTTSLHLVIEQDKHGEFVQPTAEEEEINTHLQAYWQNVDLRHPKERK
jgi:hypothetical protein